MRVIIISRLGETNRSVTLCREYLDMANLSVTLHLKPQRQPCLKSIVNVALRNGFRNIFYKYTTSHTATNPTSQMKAFQIWVCPRSSPRDEAWEPRDEAWEPRDEAAAPSHPLREPPA
mgnify:FL=1